MKNLCAVMIVLMTGFASRAAAQETTGAIGGRIVDAQGLAVPGATVTATGSQGRTKRPSPIAKDASRFHF